MNGKPAWGLSCGGDRTGGRPAGDMYSGDGTAAQQGEFPPRRLAVNPRP